MSTTTNISLTKPDRGDKKWNVPINNNFDLIDTSIGGLNNSIDDLPEVERQSGTFNGTTGDVLTLSKEVDAVNEYGVEVIPTSRAGEIGDIWVTKTTTTCTVHCAVANTTDTFEVIIFYTGDVASYGGSVYRRYYVSPDAGITDHSVVATVGGLAYILDEISGTSGIIEMPGNRVYTLTLNDVTIPAGTTLRFQPGAVVSVGVGKTLTINGKIDVGDLNADTQQVFDGLGDVEFGYAATVSPQMWGALGNGSTDDIDAFTSAVNTLQSSGGGTLLVPALDGTNYYALSTPVYSYDNIRIIGEGYGSWLHNTNVDGWDKCVIIAGNTDSSAGGGAIDNETWYNFNTLTAGTKDVTLTTGAEASNFTVGDTVFLKSYDTFTAGEDLYVDTNIVEGINGAIISLRYPVLDTYTTSAPNYSKIAVMTGALTGFDGESHYMPKNIVIENLRLSNVILAGEGYYGLYLACLESRISNIWMDEISKGIGANGASYNVIENLWINNYAVGIDLAYYSVKNKLRNIWSTKTIGTTALGDIGISMHEPGGGNTLDGFLIDVNGADCYGVSSDQNHHNKVSNGTVVNVGGVKCGVLVSVECEETITHNVNIKNTGGPGIFIASGSTGSIVSACKITDPSTYGIEIGATAGECSLIGNVLGVDGSRTVVDVIRDPATVSKAWLNGNVQFNNRRPEFSTTTYSSSGAGATTLYTYTVDEASLRYHHGIQIRLAGIRSGTNDTKNVQLLFGAQVINQVDWSNSETGHFRIEAELLAESTTHVRASSVGFMGVEIEDQNYIRFANPAESADADITVVANVTNAGDTVYLYKVEILPINSEKPYR